MFDFLVSWILSLIVFSNWPVYSDPSYRMHAHDILRESLSRLDTFRDCFICPVIPITFHLLDLLLYSHGSEC